MEVPARVGRRGAIVIPPEMRKRFGIEEGAIVMAEEREDGILIRRANRPELEDYTPQRIAEFLLNSAVDSADYTDAVEEVRRLGLDPSAIPHVNP